MYAKQIDKYIVYSFRRYSNDASEAYALLFDSSSQEHSATHYYKTGYFYAQTLGWQHCFPNWNTVNILAHYSVTDNKVVLP